MRDAERARVRPARPEDEAFVASLSGRFAETRPDWRTIEEMTEGTARQLRLAFAAPADGAAMLIAEDASGAPAGFANLVMLVDFFTGERHGHVSEIAVLRDGSGAGRALMLAAEEYFREVGVRFVTLNVSENNEHAQRFYRALGFTAQLRSFVKVLR